MIVGKWYIYSLKVYSAATIVVLYCASLFHTPPTLRTGDARHKPDECPQTLNLQTALKPQTLKPKLLNPKPH